MKEFITKKGKEVFIRHPRGNDIEEVTSFFNRLVGEDTYILRYGQKVTLEGEQKWLQGIVEKIDKREAVFLQAYFQERLVGQVEIAKGSFRKKYVGTLHLGIDKDFRGEGIGEELMKLSEQEARNLGIKIIDLTVFDENDPALALYKKLGYKEFGKLPRSIAFRGEMVDEVYMYKRLA